MWCQVKADGVMFNLFTFTIFGSPVRTILQKLRCTHRFCWSNWDSLIQGLFFLFILMQPLCTSLTPRQLFCSPQSLCVFSAFVFLNKLCKQLNLSISTKNSQKLRAKHFIVTILSFMITRLVFWPIGCLFLFKLLSNKKRESRERRRLLEEWLELYDGKAPCCVLSGF